MSKLLQDSEYLFSIITMLVTKSGGKIVITEEEMKNVSTGDLIGMYYEPKTGNLILKKNVVMMMQVILFIVCISLMVITFTQFVIQTQHHQHPALILTMYQIFLLNNNI